MCLLLENNIRDAFSQPGSFWINDGILLFYSLLLISREISAETNSFIGSRLLQKKSLLNFCYPYYHFFMLRNCPMFYLGV